MKKSELKETIRTLIKEQNEDLKAQSMCKATIFKIKKQLQPFIKFLIKNNILQLERALKINPYNNGYQLTYKGRINRQLDKLIYSKKDSKYDDIMILDYNSSTPIVIQPGSRVGHDLQKYGEAEVSVSLPSYSQKRGISQGIKFKNFKELKNSLQKVVDEFKKQLNIAKRLADLAIRLMNE